jgi:hypothetical protein
MTTVNTSRRSKTWLYVVLTLVLLACLWVGWRDFDPWIPREQVRESIRSTIRWVIQVLVQYAIPGAIVIFFGREILAKHRGKQRPSSDET